MVAVLFEHNFYKKLKMPMIVIQLLKIFYLDPYFKEIVESYQYALREIIVNAVQAGIPVPCFSAALVLLMIVIEQTLYQLIYYRHNVITLVHTRINVLIVKEFFIHMDGIVIE